MSRPRLFNSLVPQADANNEAGGQAYKLSPRHALARLAATGCLSNTFYADADTQLDTLLKLIHQVGDATFLAKLALYSRRRAFLKDMPAALLLSLSKKDRALFTALFPRIIDNGRLLRTLFQFLRSGRFGRRSLSSCLQRTFQRWLNQANVGTLLSASIGNDPSLRDVLRLARPTPVDNSRRALFGWLTGKPTEKWAPATQSDLPEEVQDLIRFRAAAEDEQLEILQRRQYRWDLLADSVRSPLVWAELARQMGPQALRMNLNTLLRHGVFDQNGMIQLFAERLADEQEVRRSRQFPYQFFAAYQNTSSEIPDLIRQALEKAAEIACGNVPVLPGPVLIGVDVSGSMGSPVTGHQGRITSTKMRCVDAAALFAAAVLRSNPGSILVPFDDRAHSTIESSNERVLALARRLASFGGGGTDCSIPLREANTTYRDRVFAGVVLVSDNQSWIGRSYSGTGVVEQWGRFLANQARLHSPYPAKLVCIDLQPYGTVQAPDSDDTLNVGGFSDAVFDVINNFLRDDAAGFVKEIERIELPTTDGKSVLL